MSRLPPQHHRPPLSTMVAGAALESPSTIAQHGFWCCIRNNTVTCMRILEHLQPNPSNPRQTPGLDNPVTTQTKERERKKRSSNWTPQIVLIYPGCLHIDLNMWGGNMRAYPVSSARRIWPTLTTFSLCLFIFIFLSPSPSIICI